jgi:hypothetical protein
MDPDAAQFEIRDMERTIAYLRIEKEILQTYVNEWTTRFEIMQGSRNRWRSLGIDLADVVYKRWPFIPNLDSFYSLLNDPLDGDGVS